MADDPEQGWLTITFELGAMPIAGVVRTAEGETPFTGWIELTGLIESIHHRIRATASPDTGKFVDPPR